MAETTKTAEQTTSRLGAAMGAAAGSPTGQMKPFERFRFQINQVRGDIAKMVGTENVDRFTRVCLNAVQANPKVLYADRRTLLLACMKAAQDNLLPDGREAVFNIYGTKVKEGGVERWVDTVQYLPMVYGLVQKIYEAGATYVDAVAVYDADEFDYQRGDDPKITHKPFPGGAPGSVKAAYVVVKLRTGETKREVMWKWEIERVREKSKQPNGLMWNDFYDQGAIKSVIHRIVKQLPRAARLGMAIAHDNEAVGLEEIAPIPADEAGVDLEAIIDGRIASADKVDPAKGGGDKGAGGGDTSKGSPELKARYIKIFEESKDPTVMAVKMDEVRFLKWESADLKEIELAYQKRLSALQGE